jgi:4-deoxy-L-threo-5-hexosulose-uronate ketol-isomerase
MKLYQMADPVRYKRMTTEELRETFLVEDLFKPGTVELVYADLDRTVIGSAVPLATPLTLETQPELRATYFTERRELGVLNVGGKGSVEVEGTKYSLDKLDCLYVGRGNPKVVFSSDDAANPAQFYLLSYPAHAVYPTTLAKKEDADVVHLGSLETCNKRTIYRLIHLNGVKSCQLVMGFTQLAEGSNWNTMPPHTHNRRSEVYFYFDLGEQDRVMHLMGPGDETRHLVMADKQVVLSPGWSIHAGVGTRAYTFCWGMGGENQVYDDMDPVPVTSLK